MTGQRRSLAQFGGAIETRGDAALAATLADAWRAAAGPGRELTHGFHAYPARSHPLLVRRLLQGLLSKRSRVVDPFLGSGTTLIEAFAAGHRALGGDVNGLAVRLARLKCWRPSPVTRAALLEAARQIARRGAASARQKDSRSQLAVPQEVLQWFDSHVFCELDVLGQAVDAVRDTARHRALILVLSSLLTKLSRKSADTSDATVAKRIAPGLASRWFAQRCEELVEGLAALDAAAPRGTPPPWVALADARRLPFADRCADLVLTSPPYVGTYDYSDVQELRARLLGIALTTAERYEIGRREPARAGDGAVAGFRRDFASALREMRRILAPGGRLLLIVGDSVADERPVAADELVAAAAAGTGLTFEACASQERPADHLQARPTLQWGRGGRREHLLLFARK